MIKKVQKKTDMLSGGSSVPTIKRDVLYQKPSNGRLKVPDFEMKVKSLLITWVKRILSQQQAR